MVDFVRKIEEAIEPSLVEKGYEVVRVLFLGTTHRTLQIMIDRLDGLSVTLDDCTTVSRLVSVLLDQHASIEGSYDLEISSPGMNRPLVKKKDYTRFQGEEVMIKTHQPLNNRKTFIGQLGEVTETAVTLILKQEAAENVQISIPFTNIHSSRLQKL